jgi:AbrB family looped-hinge helix DNA binding protein
MQLCNFLIFLHSDGSDKMPVITQTYTLRLRDRGQVTIPREVRDKLMAEAGDMLTLLQINDLMLLTRRQPRVPALTEHFTAESEQKGS